MRAGMFYRPDFVIVGCPADTGVTVYASDTLETCQIVADTVTFRPGGDDPFDYEPIRSLRLSAAMSNMMWAAGTDYADALRRLTDDGFGPTRDPRTAITPPLRALP